MESENIPVKKKVLCIVESLYPWKEYLIDMETGYINGYSGWIFAGLSHVKQNHFIPRKYITEEVLEDLFKSGELYFKNGKCKFTVRDIDHGTTREWGNRPTRIFFTEK